MAGGQMAGGGGEIPERLRMEIGFNRRDRALALIGVGLGVVTA